MFNRFAPVLGLVGLALALAGCSGSPGGSGPAPNGQGYYKIGNPYQIDGAWYYPNIDWSYDETGIASWYGSPFHGKYTANGELYDMNAVTGAHRTLPIPSIVQVTNLDNGRSIQVRINDRGPYARGRIIDVSRRAAQLLGFENIGTAKVRVQILVQETMQAQSLAQGNGGPDLAAAPLIALPVTKVRTESLTPPAQNGDAAAKPPLADETRPAQQLALAPPAAAAAPPAAPSNAAVATLPVAATHMYIQAGAFGSADNAARLKQRLDGIGNVQVTSAKVNGMQIYRVRLGPIDNVDEADSLLNKVINSGASDAKIVVD
ncbi:MAG TPA: septal ring lytic transglycosylase RlpA family protein [Stellaceae bacterium]|nr:septal ring lytic transglycosylase RlpA family protein [Stellaceae bacterium]